MDKTPSFTFELRKKFSQAQSTGMVGVLDQLQNMLDQVSIEIRTKSALQAVDKERERRIEEGKDPEDDVLNIGEIE